MSISMLRVGLSNSLFFRKLDVPKSRQPHLIWRDTFKYAIKHCVHFILIYLIICLLSYLVGFEAVDQNPILI